MSDLKWKDKEKHTTHLHLMGRAASHFIPNPVNAVNYSVMWCWLLRKLLPARPLCRFLLLVFHGDIAKSNTTAFKQTQKNLMM